VDAEAGDRHQADRPGDDVAHFLQLVLKALVMGDDIPTGLVQKLTLPGQGKLLASPFQKGNPETEFDRAQLLTDSGLGDVVKRCRATERSGLDEVTKHAKRFNLHGYRDYYRYLSAMQPKLN